MAAALVFVLAVHRHEPIQGWLFFRYLQATALAGLFSATCLIAGHALLLKILGRVLPLDEHLAIALPLGVFSFFLTSFGFGMLGFYGAPFFLLCPVLLIALGARSFLRTLQRLVRHGKRLDLRPSLGPMRGAILGLGCVSILLLWFSILSPQNASADARWYHLPIAENYVAQGGIVPFSEGWVPGAYPQLASLLYAWAFSMPGMVFDRVVTAAHMEFAIFLMTLIGLGPIVRRVIGRRVPLAWAALFLFPGIFCYDSGLVLGADHVAALFAAPIFLVSLRYLQDASMPYALLLGVFVAAALNTKYTAAIMVPLVLAIVAVRMARDLRRGSARSAAAPALMALLAVLVLTAPHWLKNALYYGDPLFPLLRKWLSAEPWHAAAEAPYATWYTPHSPPLAVSSLLDMAKTLVTFSFLPHNFPHYHRDVPVFGSLFTLCTPLLAFMGPRRRLHWLFIGAYLAIASWFWIHQFDRYLQVVVPWMAAATAAVLVLLWAEGGVLRWSMALLVGVQVVWGAAVPFIPSHAAAGSSIQKVVIDLLSRGYKNDGPLSAYPEWEEMGRALPRGSKVLVHEEVIHTGLSAATVLDYAGDQGALYWGEPGAASPVEVWRLLRSHGVSHLLWAKNLDHGTDTVAAGLVFFDFAVRHTRRIGTFGGFVLAELTDTPPPYSPPGEVAYYPCVAKPPGVPPKVWNPIWSPRGLGPPPLSAGLYPLSALARSQYDRRPTAPAIEGVSREQALQRARFLVHDARCHGRLPDEVREKFELLAARGEAMLLVRRAP